MSDKKKSGGPTITNTVMSKSASPEVKAEAAKKPASDKKSKWAQIERIIMYAGIAIFIGSMILPPDFRNGIALVVNAIVSPFTSTMPFYVVILAICIIVNVFSTIIQKYTTDWELMRSVNRKMQALNKERREAQLAGDKKKLKKLDEEQMALMSQQSQVSMQTMKPMFYIVFISIPLFWWEYWYLSQPANYGLTVMFPLLGTHLLTEPFMSLPLWLWWSLLCSFPTSFIIRKALNLVTQ